MKALTIHQDMNCCYICTLLGGTNIYAAFSTFHLNSFPQKLSNYVFLEIYLGAG